MRSLLPSPRTGMWPKGRYSKRFDRFPGLKIETWGTLPGSNVTRAPDARAGAVAWNEGSMRTEPVKCAAGPVRESCEPLRMILIAPWSLGVWPCAPNESMQSEITSVTKILMASLLAPMTKKHSESGHLQHSFRKAGSLEFQPGSSLVNLLEIVLRQLDVHCSNVFL